ncbi:MAG: M23 family metallopeptidase [Bacteroidales bacterium]|jgi:murein DD-endopeptidase MepM/ murein hydrolase activator NlpD|nr:M23 family metallopeptidase [Bacteroidales bacterium]
MKKTKIRQFAVENKLVFALLSISITFTVVTIIILYIRFKKMKTATVPLKGKVTSKFGKRIAPTSGASTEHNGVDIAATVGTKIVCPLDGVVSDINTHKTGGKQLIIKHVNGYKTGYAHLSGYNVVVGEKVKQNQVIAFVGNTGVSTGAHLHFTVTNPLGIKVNPEDYFNFEN